DAVKGLLARHSVLGTADDGGEMIERAAGENPDNIDLLSLLADAYVESEKPADAERIIGKVVAKDASLFLRLAAVAQLYIKANQVEDAMRVIGAIADRAASDIEQEQLLSLINELLTIDSDNVAALRLLVKVYWTRRQRDELINALETLADAAQAAGLASDERYALTLLARLN